MKPSDVRQRVLQEHAGLRAQIHELQALAQRFEQGDREVTEGLREQGLALFESFAAHLQLEDSSLAPALRAGGSEGERRADRLAHEHHEQRELLTYLMSRLEKNAVPTLVVARELQNFGEYLLLDMAHEEEDLLGEDVLGTD